MLRNPRTLLRAAVAAAVTGVLAAPGCGAEAPGEPTRTSSAAIVGGAGNVTVSTASQVVNRYTTLAADAAVAATTLTVGSAAALAPLARGDLLLIVQMQGATIDTTNTASYGNVTALGSAGLYELVTLDSVNAATNVLTLNAGCGLKNSYKTALHTQVIWVPQYQALTVSGAGSIAPSPWNGQVGGVVALQAQTASLETAGAIDVAGAGFRGGVVKQNTTLPLTAAPPYASTTNTAAAEKGEGIGGYHTEYDANGGRYGIGAPANGGGGGGPHNSGGGGGSNGSSGTAWTGAGVMPAGVTGATAWALDPEDMASGGLTLSSGGGRGGYSYSASTRNPLVVAPGNALWTGDDRQQHGGRGGRPLAPSALTRVFLGGGGGAGESNNGAGTSGATGGGIALVLAGSIDGAGTGSIVADGATAQTTMTGGGLNGNDAPGGGGGGGTVILLAPTVTNLTVSANGGGGGLQNIAAAEAEGPGGGGGGGFIAAPASFAAASVAGGAGGTTNSTGVVGFARNGATDGAAGATATIAAGSPGPVCIATDLAIAMSDGGGTVTAGGSVVYTITVTNSGPNPATGAALTDTFSGAFAGDTWTCTGTACPAASGSGNVSATLLALASGGTVTFTVTGTVASSATGTLSNTATVTAPAGIVDSNLANNTVTVTNTLAASADLAVTLAHAPANVTVDTAYTYTVGVTNAGPSNATGVQATLALPVGVTYQGFSGAGWACAFAAPTVTCTRATVAGGASVPITVNVTASGTAGPATATAVVSATTGDPTAGNNTATATFNFLCGADSDCASTQWCTGAGACVAKTPNGQPVPPTAPVSGQCSAPNGARACASGACDLNGNLCGISLGDGTCASTLQCTAGLCIAAGPNAGRCELCASDSNCAAPTPACEPVTSTCVQCTSTNGAACTGTAPLCSAGDTCVGCNGDNGTGASHACPAASPYCSATGACIQCTSDAMCTTGSHPGPYCVTSTGACGTSCQSDAECGAGQWCNAFGGAGVCQPKVPNGMGVTGQACTTTLGARACVAGVCDTSDNLCGYKNGDGPCAGSGGGAVCRSTICAGTGPNTGLCEQCGSNTDCAAGQICDAVTNACRSGADAGTDAGMSDGGADSGADAGPSDAAAETTTGEAGADGEASDAGDAAAESGAEASTGEDGGPGDSGMDAAGIEDGGKLVSSDGAVDNGSVAGGGCACGAAGTQSGSGGGQALASMLGIGVWAARRRRRSARR